MMGGGRRARLALIGVLCAIGALLLVPAAGNAADETVKLVMPSGGPYKVTLSGSPDQVLTTPKNGCQISSPAGTLLDLSTGGTAGISADSIGIKSPGSNSNGTPCSQVDATEVLKIKPGSALGGRTIVGVMLDLEMTGNAVVKATFVGATNKTFMLQTGTSITAGTGTDENPSTPQYEVTSGPTDLVKACASPQSSGPNSGANDNCVWTINPGGAYTQLWLTVDAAYGGTVSLEGGSDTGVPSEFRLNLTPTAASDSYSIDEDTTLTVPAPGVLDNDIDAPSATLTASVVSGPSHAASFVFDGNGSFTYTPAADYNGSDSFSYKVNDGVVDSNVATVTITVRPVNDPPVAVSDTGYSTDEDTPLTVTAPGVLGNDSDVDSPSLSAVLASGPSGGSVTLNADGSFTYTPSANFNGSDSFTYTAFDGSASSNVATVSITVNAVNDAPTVTNPGSLTANEGDTVSVQIVASDVDGNGLSFSATGLPDGLTIDPSTGLISGTVSFTASDGSPYSTQVTVTDGITGTSVTFTWTVYDTICTTDTVGTTDLDHTGYFTKLSGDGTAQCKAYTIGANAGDGTVSFQPMGSSTVDYRAFIVLGSDTPPAVGSVNGYELFVEYDPAGGTDFKQVPWCIDPAFTDTVPQTEIPDIDIGWLGGSIPGVTSATIPTGNGDSWCIAGAYVHDVGGNLVTTWQLFGQDDPKFR